MGLDETLEDDIAALLRARYGDDAPGVTGPWSDALSLMVGHKTIRAYRPDPLPEGTVEKLVIAAQSAATSHNFQFWSVIAFEDQARRNWIADLCGSQGHIERAPLFLLFLADLARSERVAAQAGGGAEALDYMESLIVGFVDAAIAAQNAVIAAESLGLGTVYIGGLRNNLDRIHEGLQLPPFVAPAFGLCVGYADPERPARVKPRLPIEAVLHRDAYRLPEQDAAIARYDETMKLFQRAEKMPDYGWTPTTANRVSNVKVLMGRARLRDFLHSFGFALK